MDDARALAGRRAEIMRLMREDFDPQRSSDLPGWDDNAEEVADKIEALFIGRLAAPEGAGLTRYAIRPTTFHDSAAYEAIDRPDGQWVRHEDAAAALAAERSARAANLAAYEIAARNGRKAEDALADAEVERDALKAALEEIEEFPLQWTESEAAHAMKDIARAALSPASEGKT